MDHWVDIGCVVSRRILTDPSTGGRRFSSGESLRSAIRMSRGNKRDIDRARAQARNEKAGGKTQKDKDGLTPEQRRERDAKALQEKAARKAAAAAGGGKK